MAEVEEPNGPWCPLALGQWGRTSANSGSSREEASESSVRKISHIGRWGHASACQSAPLSLSTAPETLPQDPIPNPSGRTFVLREPIALTARPPHTCNCDRPWSHPSVGLVRIRGLTLTQVVFGSFPPFLTSKVNLRHFTFRLPHAPASEMQKMSLSPEC